MIKRNKGLTLIECLMALSLCAFIFAPLAMSFAISLKTWKENNHRNDLMQHARVAMDRITSELRYATKLNNADDTQIEFETAHLLDSDDSSETIHYQNSSQMIQRTVDDGTPHLIAGIIMGNEVGGYIYATQFESIPLKSDGAGGLTPLVIPPDTLSMAIAVRVTIGLTDESGYLYTLTSLVKMRNI